MAAHEIVCWLFAVMCIGVVLGTIDTSLDDEDNDVWPG